MYLGTGDAVARSECGEDGARELQRREEDLAEALTGVGNERSGVGLGVAGRAAGALLGSLAEDGHLGQPLEQAALQQDLGALWLLASRVSSPICDS